MIGGGDILLGILIEKPKEKVRERERARETEGEMRHGVGLPHFIPTLNNLERGSGTSGEGERSYSLERKDS